MNKQTILNLIDAEIIEATSNMVALIYTDGILFDEWKAYRDQMVALYTAVEGMSSAIFAMFKYAFVTNFVNVTVELKGE